MIAVLDASVAIAWMAPDEASPVADAWMLAIAQLGAVVPSLWYLEVVNILLLKERRKRLTRDEVAGILADLQHIRVTPDTESPLVITPRVAALAQEHQLTAYDAAYLELPGRQSLPLLTFDARLASAAEAAGVAIGLT